MKNYLLILQLLPMIIETLKAMEVAVPEPGKGVEKLEAVRQILVTVNSAVAELWPQIESVIAILVDLFNKVGVFKKA